MAQLVVDGQGHDIDVESEMPLLWVLRDELGYKGPKYGCGIGQCGACTVHIDSKAVKSCSIPVGEVSGVITTIQGLADGDALHPVQEAWLEHQVAQCGYCQAGQMMAAVDLLSSNPNPSDLAIDRAMSSNLCRCGTYPRIRAAVKAAAGKLNGQEA